MRKTIAKKFDFRFSNLEMQFFGFVLFNSGCVYRLAQSISRKRTLFFNTARETPFLSTELDGGTEQCFRFAFGCTSLQNMSRSRNMSPNIIEMRRHAGCIPEHRGIDTSGKIRHFVLIAAVPVAIVKKGRSDVEPFSESAASAVRALVTSFRNCYSW